MRRRSVLLAASAAALTAPLSGRAFAASADPVSNHTVVADLDGSTSVDLSQDLGPVRGLSAGTILATFRTTSHHQAMTLLSASDPAEPGSNVTLSLNQGALQFSVREKGTLVVDVLTRSTRYDDGLQHTVAVTADSSGIKLHAGGRIVFETYSTGFFASVSSLSALTLGANKDSDHTSGEWFFTGKIERTAVWDRVLTEAELVAEAPRPDLADLGKLSLILNGTTPATWLFTGDSITHGALHTHGWRSYCEHWMERVRWELGKPKNQDFMIDTGVSGATSAQLEGSFAPWVTAFSPDVVSIMIGTNDIASGIGIAAYQANLVSLTRAVRALPGAPIPVLQSPNPVDPAKWPGRVALDAYATAMGEVAAQEKAVFVDHYRDWLPDSGAEVPLNLLNDGLHPNQRGHHRLAIKMIKDLRIFDPASAVCSLNVP